MKKLCLAIMDGYGINEKNHKIAKVQGGSLLTGSKLSSPAIFQNSADPSDAVCSASNADFIELFNKNPYTLLEASGEAVGLPKGQMGNSEVGHLNIGAGSVVMQDLLRISSAFKDESIMNNKNFVQFLNSKSVKHIIGLVSNGNVHSSIEHAFYILDYLNKHNQTAYVHIITDGRDTPVNSGLKFAEQLYKKAKQCNCKIASISGRYYAMDREQNLDRTKLYFDTIYNNNKASDEDLLKYISNCYENNITDEFIKPQLLCNDGSIKDGDSVLFFNFRADRVRQITQMFLEKTKCNVFTMTEYKKEFKNAKIIFKANYQKNTLSEILSKKGVTQLKVAEFSKYAHVTYFLNGGIEKAFYGEDRVMCPMVDVPTFDKKPEMSAKNVTNEVIKGMQNNYGFICVNYANCDMVGHTGNLEAAKKAVNCVTSEILRLYKEAVKNDYILVVTADHGNAECMVKNEDICTTHTTNRVPLLVLNAGKINLKNNGGLSNIAPTIIELMDL